jgi:hypothetical protein
VWRDDDDAALVVFPDGRIRAAKWTDTVAGDIAFGTKVLDLFMSDGVRLATLDLRNPITVEPVFSIPLVQTILFSRRVMWVVSALFLTAMAFVVFARLKAGR